MNARPDSAILAGSCMPANQCHLSSTYWCGRLDLLCNILHTRLILNELANVDVIPPPLLRRLDGK